MAERVAKSSEALVVPPGAGRPLGRPDTAASGTLKASSEETGGAVTVFESTRPVGDTGGPQAHLHRDADEMFYVLEGEYRFQLGDRVVDAPRGTFVFVPRGTPHAFRNKGAETGRMLTVVAPGGLERFFAARRAAAGRADPRGQRGAQPGARDGGRGVVWPVLGGRADRGARARS